MSEPSHIDSNRLEDLPGRLQIELNLYMQRHSDQAQIIFLEAFFKSLVEVVRERGSELSNPCISSSLGQQEVLRLATRHLYHDWKLDLYRGIITLNEAISHLNRSGIITIPIVDASKILAKNTRPQAVNIDEDRWSSYLKVEKLHNFFLRHFELQDNVEELAFAVVFSMVVNGCHFHKSYLSIIDISRADFNPDQSWILLQKKYGGKRMRPQVKSRFFVSAASIILLLRLLKLSPDRITSLNDRLFPASLLGRNRTGNVFSKKFKCWLNKLVAAYHTHVGERDNHDFSFGVIIKSITINELYQGARIWTALRYPFFETSYLSQKIVPGQLSSVNYRALFSSDHVVYSTRLRGSGSRRSWLSFQPSSASDAGEEIAEDSYLQLMNIHSSVAQQLRSIHGKMSKKVKADIASEIERLSESLPFPSSTLSHMENGYLSNYRLLLDWLVVMVQEKNNAQTVFDYFSDIANAFFFVLSDTCIISLGQYELSDIVFELIHSSASPRTQRNIKNKVKQFLSFLGARYAMPKLDWNHPDYWIFDEPMEREIMSLSEFDKVFQGIDTLVDLKHADTLKAVIILLFYAGLRIHEAALLSHDAVYIDSELNIFIRKSKTRSGKRTLPLHYLLPDNELKFFRDYVLRTRPKGPRRGAPLFSLDSVSFPDPEVLANVISAVIFEFHGRHITCHQLRHSFASLLLLRWYALIKGTKSLELSFVDSFHSVFTSAELEKLKKLFLGEGPMRLGDKYFMHAIIVISRLLGHAGPLTTVNVYIHTIDVLYRLFLVEEDGNLFFGIRRASQILGVSYPTTRRLAEGSKMVSLSTILKYSIAAYKIPEVIV